MAFQIACQECGQTHSVGEELAGRQRTCRNCGGKLPVPGQISVEAESGNPFATTAESVIVATPVGTLAAVPSFWGDANRLEALFPSGNAGTMAAWLHEFFCAKGYRLENGTPHSGVYGVGNDTARILLGAFVRRYKFQVDVGTSAGGVWLRVTKGMSGALGGLIGYMAMKRETKRIFESLQVFLQQRASGK